MSTAKSTVIVCAASAMLTMSAGCSVFDLTALPYPAGSDTGCKESLSHERWWPFHGGHASLSTGVYIREDDDLVVNSTLPIVLRRTYNSGDAYSRQFGMNAMHSGEWWIHGDRDPRVPWGDLILPNGARIHFARVSPGDTRDGAVLRHDATPTEFNGALLSWTGSLWEMRFCDGSTASFVDCRNKPYSCSLIERRDADGHRISYVRDATGTLLRMESEGQSIAFQYDEHKRITRAFDTLGNDVSYTYDDSGRLTRATRSDGTVREYEYDERSKLVVIREPGRILQNWFDDEGRWVKQVVRRFEEDDDPYVATARYVVENGSIVETDFDEGDGLEIYRYNKSGYVVSHILNADGAAPVGFTYDLDPVSNTRRSVTMWCAGADGPIKRTLPPTLSTDPPWDALTREGCQARH